MFQLLKSQTRTGLLIIALVLGLMTADLLASRKANYTHYNPTDLPFQVGEELDYNISWGVIPAGKGSIKVPNIDGEDGVYHIVTTARSNRFVDTFYKVRNRIETFLDMNKDRSRGYKKVQREGTNNRDVDLIFDHDENKATLVKNGKVKSIIPVPEGIHDPLSAIYYLRTVEDWNEEPVLSVTDGKKNYDVRIRVLGKEIVETPLGYFETVKIEPVVEDMEIIFDKKKGGRLFIWLTDDNKKIPVKMESELYFGSIQVLLSKAEFPFTSE